MTEPLRAARTLNVAAPAGAAKPAADPEGALFTVIEPAEPE
ncbi:MAG TPA: hypothetical protein VGD71_41360 [Kribbella sp.]